MSGALVNEKFMLEKFPGKGGWTYARIPQVLQDKHAPFGWVRVKGSIDGVEIKKYHLMPMGNGQLFLPVKAAIRKQIKKQEGDWVQVHLYPDHDELEVPRELQQCFEDEPVARKFFNSLKEAERRYYIDWIFSAKKEDTKVERIARCIDKLLKRKKYHDTN